MFILTRKSIRRARARKKRYEISCSQSGLLLRVLPTGKKVLFYRVRTGGRDNRVRLGLWGTGEPGTITLDDAKEKARCIRDKQRAAREVVPERRDVAPLVRVRHDVASLARFRDLAEMFLARHVETAALRKSTRANYRPAVAMIVKRWGSRPLDSVRFADVEQLHRDLVKTPSGANKTIRVLHTMFEKAVQWEMFWGRNPARGVKLYRETKRKRYLSPAERARLDEVLRGAFAEVANHRGQVRWSHVFAIRLLLLTGFRMSEVLDLEWSWIDRENLEIVLEDSKTGQSARPISPAVLVVLDELEKRRKPGVPWVIYGRRDQRIERSSLTRVWRRIRRTARIEDVRVHDLRHSAASAAISVGCTLKEVGTILGHKTTKTTERYAHLTDSAARKAAQKMTEAIVNATECGGKKK